MFNNNNIILLIHRWDYLTVRPYYIGLYLSKKGYNVTMLLPSEKFIFKYKIAAINRNYKLIYCPTILWKKLKKGSDPLDIIMRIFLLIKLKYDLIIASDSRPSVILPAIFGKYYRRVPMILEWTDWFGRGGTISERSGMLYRIFFENIENFFEEYFRKYADGATVVCRPLEKRLRKLNYIKNIFDFPLPCHAVNIFNVNILKMREKLQINKRKPLIGCVGTLFKTDAELLFESFKLIKRKMDANLILIGINNSKGTYKIPEGVFLTGNIGYDKLLEYVYCCDLMVIPLKNNIANNGRWPSKLNDYLVMGKPVVSTEISVVNELFHIVPFGELSKDNPNDFSNKILSLLNDRTKLKRYGKNAKRIAENQLNWNTVMKQFIVFINQTISDFNSSQNKTVTQ